MNACVKEKIGDTQYEVSNAERYQRRIKNSDNHPRLKNIVAYGDAWARLMQVRLQQDPELMAAMTQVPMPESGIIIGAPADVDVRDILASIGKKLVARDNLRHMVIEASIDANRDANGREILSREDAIGAANMLIQSWKHGGALCDVLNEHTALEGHRDSAGLLQLRLGSTELRMAA